jgi:Protein involved in biosynthesis of mitomycin antibiotics/polyketide fumonisin
VEKNGLEKMHEYFSANYIPFLQFALNKKLKKLLYKQIFEIIKFSLKTKNDFYVDQTLNFRIHYPFKIAKKSSISRSVYRGINLENFKNSDMEINQSISKSQDYVMDKSDTTKVSYFGRLPVTCYTHSPHRDTWFGHSINGLNLWWGITDVNTKNGVILYRDVAKYNLKHLKQPAYVEDIYDLGKSVVPKLNSGDLLVFDPEILHATRLNTSEMTRIVFSGRIDFKKPRFDSKILDYQNHIGFTQMI